MGGHSCKPPNLNKNRLITTFPLTQLLREKHTMSRNSCLVSNLWILISRSSELNLCIEHPGGMGIILKYAGKDATEEFEPIHPPDTLDKYLDKSKHLGPVDLSTVAKVAEQEDPEEADRQQRISNKPLLSQCYNLMDFESVAKNTMKRGAWGYYSSAADDEIVCLATINFGGLILTH